MNLSVVSCGLAVSCKAICSVSMWALHLLSSAGALAAASIGKATGLIVFIVVMPVSLKLHDL